MNIDEKLSQLMEKVESLKDSGSTVNVHNSESQGSCSCLVKKTKNGKTYELKVYSNDIDRAILVVREAVAQSQVLDEQLESGDINE